MPNTIKRVPAKKPGTIKKTPVKKAVKRKPAKKKALPKRKRPPGAISAKDKMLADLYMGGDDTMRGSAGACYRFLHPTCKPGTAETEGPAVLRKPQVRAYLKTKTDRIEKKTDINAQWVLENAVEMYNVAMSKMEYTETQEAEVPEEVVNNSGDPIVVMTKKSVSITKRTLNLAAAGKALDTIGKHISVRAFENISERDGVLSLVDELARSQKRVEQLALDRQQAAKAAENVVQIKRQPGD